MKTLYSIGEFSTITGLSVKTLRFYHERGILVPSSVDEATGYRFYDAAKVEKARIIMRLREMEFSIEDIGAVLGECSDEADILNHLERQKNTLNNASRKTATSSAHSTKSSPRKNPRAKSSKPATSPWKKKPSSRSSSRASA
jgi:DNA-binding transcriptional MerR regulator